jgi:phosphoribosylformylglycinamidine synthase
MAIAGGYGLTLDLERIPHAPDAAAPEILLFSESNGRFIVEVRPENAQAFEALLAAVPCQQAGRVLETPSVEMLYEGNAVVQAEVETLRRAWHAG